MPRRQNFQRSTSSCHARFSLVRTAQFGVTETGCNQPFPVDHSPCAKTRRRKASIHETMSHWCARVCKRSNECTPVNPLHGAPVSAFRLPCVYCTTFCSMHVNVMRSARVCVCVYVYVCQRARDRARKEGPTECATGGMLYLANRPTP